MKQKTIAVVGAGNIGSRHLQALALMEQPVQLAIVDPNPSSLSVARERFAQVALQKNNLRAVWLNDFSQLPQTVDVVVVATNANVRKDIVEWLLLNRDIKHLVLEKFLFQRIGDYRVIQELLDKKNVKAWVNCARRQWPIYQNVRSKLQGSDYFRFHVSGSQIGIGCNGIHFLDLFSYLMPGNPLQISDHLDAGYISSKRDGYVEFLGTLQGQDHNKQYFSLTSLAQQNMPLVIKIDSDRLRCVINEGKGELLLSEKDNDWVWKTETFQCLFQSQLTHLVVNQLLDTGCCPLTTYAESSRLHIQLIKLFMQHMGLLADEENTLCPVT